LDFVQKIYTEKLGLKGAPEVTNPQFRAIAKDNLAEVKAMKVRARMGQPFEERCTTVSQAAQKDGLIIPPTFDSTRYAHLTGVRVELRTSKALNARNTEQMASGGTNDQGSDVPMALLVAEIGQEHSHRLVLAPEPLGPRHMFLVPRRFSKISKQATETLEVLHRVTGGEEDLGLDDFHAGAEVLIQNKERGVCFWLGLSSPAGILPVETHLQVLPDGLSSDDANGLPYPAKLQIMRMLKDGKKTLPMLDGMAHALEFPPGDIEYNTSVADLAQSLNHAYELARNRPGLKELASAPGHGMMVAFSYNWMLVLPLRAPKQGSVFEKAAYFRMPPPPACALLGVVICPSVEKQWPETAWGASPISQGKSEALVESRAEVFCIPENSAEYEKADAEVMVRWNVLEKDPLAPLKLWGGSPS